MATKLKRFSTNHKTKTTFFILTVLFVTIAVTLLQNLVLNNQSLEPIFYEQFTDSNSYRNLLINTVNSLDYEIANNIKPDNTDDFSYYAKTVKGDDYSNVSNPSKDYFTNTFSFYLFSEGDDITIVNKKYITKLYDDQITPNFSTVYLAFFNTYLHEKQTDWDNSRIRLIYFVIMECFLLLLSITFILLLILGTGRNSEDDKLHTSSIDTMHTEIQVGLMLGILFVWGCITGGTTSTYNTTNTGDILTSARIIILAVTASSTAIMMSLNGMLLLSFIRKWKGKNVMKSSYIYQITSRFYNYIKSLFDGRAFSNYSLTKALFYRQLVFIGTSILLVLFTFISLRAQSSLFLFTIPLEFLILSWFLKGNNETYEKINEGIHESMEEQLRAERMKIDLVTNVSHDLKTPLTSIISYVDLLSKEEDLSETARDYIQILGEKSERLKKIVEDLFDIAKATSGNIALNFEVIDLKKLIEQTLADMEDFILQSNKKIVTNISQTPLFIYADGDKMYRVFQNILDNALKYSLENTRIFIHTECENDIVKVTVMNTANYEMDFSEEEIVERFHRGDKSRSTDGSGLGLSIVESFTNACHGNFQVHIEGDIFKVMIRFQLLEKNSQLYEGVLYE